eukprot:1152248-Pelagomonas_calceolata.AAC.2
MRQPPDLRSPCCDISICVRALKAPQTRPLGETPASLLARNPSYTQPLLGWQLMKPQENKPARLSACEHRAALPSSVEAALPTTVRNSMPNP